ncbi:MAG: tRNA 2-thiouridine(34) synthase MnmA [Coriobacteriales bacterium]|nr:tRNA 2-thiouridine(34) synthase MnmA [Coriobacteriales bacterium]
MSSNRCCPQIQPADQRALVAMSGGVDSSVAAHLLQRAGYECTGATMHLFEAEAIGAELDSGCCSLADVEDARAVCQRLGIPHYTFNFSADFAEQVIGRFSAAYLAGCTPNPCIDCNRFLKFERLLARALETGYGYLATGHYARIQPPAEPGGRYLLQRGIDSNKDQSYVLYTLTQNQLAHTLLPLGDLTKEQTRQLAGELGLATAEKPESQDICFVPDGDYAAFIRRIAAEAPTGGDIVDELGVVLGRHDGIQNFTIGQRKRLGIATGHPLYVTAIDAASSTVIVGEIDKLYSKIARVGDVNLIATDQLEGPIRATAKHRYRGAEQSVTVRQLDADNLEVTFDEPQKAVTPGQALVIYDQETVIGGGSIYYTVHS